MATVSSRRPVVVLVLGITFVLLGLLMSFSAALFMLAAAHFPPVPPGARLGSLPLFRALLLAIGHWREVGACQVALGLLTVLASVAFLRLRNWGRVWLEAVTWLGVASAVAFFTFWAHAWLSMAEGTDSLAFAVGGPAMALCMAVMYAVVGGLVIWYLRSRTVREAMAPGSRRMGE